jgi:tetratricopeptide (TPR) repeat protein
MQKRLSKNQDHPQLVYGLSQLAVILHTLKMLPEAEIEAKAAIEMGQRLWKGDHPTIANGLNGYATILMDRGKIADAEKEFSNAIRMTNRLYPNQDHPDMGVALTGLGLFYLQTDQLSKAESLLRKAHELYSRLFMGQDNRSLASSRQNLALLLSHQGKYAEAEAEYQTALSMYRRMFPGSKTVNGNPYHYAIANVLNNLADVLLSNKKLIEAETTFREAYEINKQVFGEKHPTIPLGLSKIAHVRDYRERSQDAPSMFEEALVLQQKLVPGDNPATVIIFSNFAMCQLHRGKLDEALKHAQSALDMTERLYSGRAGSAIANQLNNMGYIRNYRGELAEAELLYHKALTINTRVYNPGHIEIGHSLSNLAFVLKDQGKFAEAEVAFVEALKIYRDWTISQTVASSEGQGLTLAASRPLTLGGFISNSISHKSKADTVYPLVWQSKSTVSRVAEQRAMQVRLSKNPVVAKLLAYNRVDRTRRAESVGDEGG